MTFAEEGSILSSSSSLKGRTDLFRTRDLHDFGALHVAVANRAKQRLFEAANDTHCGAG